jgi:hypothetical protein
VPVIKEPWMVQKYGNVPAVANLCVKFPLDLMPESQRPLAVQQLPDVVVCEIESMKFHWTLSPALIVVALVPLCESVKTIPGPTLTMRVAPEEGGGVGVGDPGGGTGDGVTRTGCVGELLSWWQAGTKRRTPAQRTERYVSFMITSGRDPKLGLLRDAMPSPCHRAKFVNGFLARRLRFR